MANIWAEQAIFTSLTRRGRAGYHIVSRSPGLSEGDTVALATWSPSHGGLIEDAENRTSVNFHPMPGDRFALSRTVAGPAEYSGRGGRQLYTHALIIEPNALRRVADHPLVLYRMVLPLGHFHYRDDPDARLEPVPLPSISARLDESAWAERARALGLTGLDGLGRRLGSGQSVQIAHAGDRTVLAECLFGLLPVEIRLSVSFATSLLPSAVRPFHLVLVGPGK
jgi:hypothetical protein